MEELYKQNNFPSKGRFIKILKKNNIEFTGKTLDDFFDSQALTQITKETRFTKQNMKYITATSQYEILQIDLVIYEKFKTQNKNYEYILIIIDVFSRYLWCVPLKTKTAKSILDGFKQAITPEILQQVEVITSDSGSEFKGVFEKYLLENDIIHFTTSVGNHSALGIVDRVCRTIRTNIQKHFLGNDTTNWVSKLPEIVALYNETEHRGIADIKPAEVIDNVQNTSTLVKLNLQKEEHNSKVHSIKKDLPFNVGDYVRIKINKSVFSKGFENNYSRLVYKVTLINNDYNVQLSDGNNYDTSKLKLVPNYTEEKFNSQKKESKLEKHTKKAKLKRIQKELE